MRAYIKSIVALVCFIGLATSGQTLAAGPIDFTQLIASNMPIFSKPIIVREINVANNKIDSKFYNGIVYLDVKGKKHPVVRSKKIQLFPMKMLSGNIAQCVKRENHAADEYYLVNVNVVSKYDEISLIPVEFSISNAELLSLFSNFNPISLSQLNCFLSNLLNKSSANYTWNDEFQKQDFIQNKINQLNQKKYQTINQNKDYYVTLRGTLGEYDFQSNSFAIRVLYLSDFSPTLANFPFNVAFEEDYTHDQITSGFFGSPTEREKMNEFRQLYNISSIMYKIDPSLARGFVSRLNGNREVNLKLLLKNFIPANKESLNCSNGYGSSNTINFKVLSMSVLPANIVDRVEPSEVRISPELEDLLSFAIDGSILSFYHGPKVNNLDDGWGGSKSFQISKRLRTRYSDRGETASETVKGETDTFEAPVDPDAKGPESVQPPKPAEDEIFTAVDQQAEFPGGPRAFGAFLQRNLRYPAAAQRANVGGKVYVQFVVNTDGSIQDVQILKSVGFGCDEEAMRIIKAVPRWTPGKQSGRIVRSRFTQPITFVLSE